MDAELPGLCFSGISLRAGRTTKVEGDIGELAFAHKSEDCGLVTQEHSQLSDFQKS